MTRDFTVRGFCQAKKGLLFLRDCGAPALAQCHLCGRPVCEAHQVLSEKGPQCPECAAQSQPGDILTRSAGRGDATSRAWLRGDYYDRYHYLPWYFGHASYYSDRDYRTFDEARSEEAAAAVAAREGAEDVDFSDLDDFAES
ncbi:MAG: hypothetical protein AB1896_19275 [Thermodesulfobacteriota bacterium]